MPLPLLSRTDFSRTNETPLPLSDYFHPVKNPNWYLRSQHQNASRGLISIGSIKSIAQNLIVDKHLPDEVINITNHQYSGGNGNIDHILKAVGDRLPEEYQYLRFSMAAAHQSNISAETEKWKLYFYYPRNNGNYEFYAQHRTYDIIVHKATTAIPHYHVLDTVLDDAFNNQLFKEHLALADQQWTANAGMYVYSSDSYMPRIPTAVFAFANNISLFYPGPFVQEYGIMREHGLMNDFFTTEQLLTLVNAGNNFTFSLRNGRRIDVEFSPPVGDRRMYEKILPYSTNILGFLKYNIRGPKEPKATLYGVELEANGNYTPKEIITAQKDLFFLMKQDSSIYGSMSQSYEFVSVPASLKAHKRLWAEFFENIDYTKFDTSKDTGNGMHVHIDRKAFGSSHLRRFTWFITNPANFEFMFAISERPTRDNFMEWAVMPELSRKNRTKYEAARNAVAHTQGLRGAVHYKGSKTVEIRMFKGLVSYATIVKNLEFVDSAVEFSRETSLIQITLRNYLAWLEKTPKNKYETLKLFIKELKMNEILAAADVVEYVWNDTNDQHVIQKMNAAPFTLTNFHITSLNRRRKKRTFILENGKIVCVKPNGGILAKLDKSVQQKQTRGAATFTMNDFAA